MSGLQCIGGRGRSSAHRGVPGGWGSWMALRHDICIWIWNQRLNKVNNINDDLAHLELHTLPNLGTAFPYGCYVL